MPFAVGITGPRAHVERERQRGTSPRRVDDRGEVAVVGLVGEPESLRGQLQPRIRHGTRMAGRWVVDAEFRW